MNIQLLIWLLVDLSSDYHEQVQSGFLLIPTTNPSLMQQASKCTCGLLVWTLDCTSEYPGSIPSGSADICLFCKNTPIVIFGPSLTQGLAEIGPRLVKPRAEVG